MTRRRRLYTPTERADALDLVARAGIAAAHKELGIPRPTLSTWASEAGVVPNSRNAQRTEEAREEALRRADERRTELVTLLSEVAVEGARLELGILNPRHELAGDVRVYVDEDTGTAHPYSPARLDQIVGARTRAIHDLNLITGQATANAALIVRIEIPRPDPRAADAGAVEEAELVPELPQ